MDQQVGQVTAQDLDLADDPLPTEVLHPHLGAVPPVGVDIGDALLVQGDGLGLVDQSHPLQHRAPRPRRSTA